MYRTLLFVFCLMSISVLRAQIPFSKEFWLNDAGTPVAVNDLAFCNSGYMWIGTENGLYKFNGTDFVLVPDSIQQPVTALGKVGENLFVGYKSGEIALIGNRSIIPFHIKNNFPTSPITSVHGSGPLLWVTTEDEGLFLIVNGVGLQLTTEQGLTDNFLYGARWKDDELMVTTDRGINHITWKAKQPAIRVSTTTNGLPDNIVRVLVPIPATTQSWLGTQEGGIALYDHADVSFLNFRMAGSWAWGQVNDILPTTKDEAFVATEEGYLLKVTKYGDSLEVLPYTHDGIKLKKLIRDKTGNIWCATNKGLLLSTALYASGIRLPQPFNLRNVTSVMCDRKGNLWYTQNRELYKVPLDYMAQPRKIVVADAPITSLWVDRKDRLWVGTFGKGLYYYSGKDLVPIETIPELKEGHILSIASANKRLWVSSLNGVEEAIPDNPGNGSIKGVRHHNKLSGTGSDYVYQLYADRKKRVWFATDGGGVCMFDGTAYQRWDSSSGLTSQVVYSITEDASGDIWAGTLEQGLFRYRDNRWEQLKDVHGLQGTNITSLRGNASGHVIIVNEEGIDQWYPQSKQFRHYNRRLGIDIDSTSEILNCITNDTNGNVYVPFEHGFLVFNNQEQHHDITPQVKISAISLFLEPLANMRTEFNHDQNHISFRYDGINFSNPDRLHYRYMLEGYNNNWIYTNDEEIPFSQLPAGEYNFRVQASMSNLFDVADEDSFAFTIGTPFWQKAWFIVVASMLLAGSAIAFVRIRERGIRNMSRLQKERMVFEYEHLKSQVNPHFLFNSLNTLVSLIEDDQEAAVDYTVHLSDLYRNMLSYRDQDLILLSEEYEIIQNYMYIQKSRFGDALNLHTEIPEAVLKSKKIVPLALQLLVENAIKHNVVSVARPLTISIVATESEIVVKNPVQTKLSKEKGAGLGLANIQNRYRLLTQRKVGFGISDNEYIVILPLL